MINRELLCIGEDPTRRIGNCKAACRGIRLGLLSAIPEATKNSVLIPDTQSTRHALQSPPRSLWLCPGCRWRRPPDLRRSTVLPIPVHLL